MPSLIRFKTEEKKNDSYLFSSSTILIPDLTGFVNMCLLVFFVCLFVFFKKDKINVD